MIGDREKIRLRSGWLLLVTLFMLSTPTLLRAVDLEFLINPGELSEHHAAFEDDCGLCHTETDEAQSVLCVDCHTGVGIDVSSGEGLHGRHPDAGNNECASCHTEHEGRDTDIVAFDIAAFLHVWTDFTLRGAHDMTLCTDCHQAGSEWAAATSTCSVCHAQEDVHQGQMHGLCSDCHSEVNWQSATFDHSGTAFLLTGGHVEAACTDCHQEHVYHGASTQCSSCHVEEDVHQGRNGSQCESCHSTADWTLPEFDHLAVTRFPLLGAHEPLACETCHTQDLMTSLPTSCHGCHQTDDVHAGGLGSDCGSCHGVSTWTSTGFDHSQVTSFPLLGAHDELQCTMCHIESVDVGLPVDCAGCHTADPHVGQLGSQCESCHSESTWTASVRFDHGLTPFPLIGAHEMLTCETCHATPAYHDAAETCSGCHSSSDVHAGRLGPQCETCHAPSDWQFWRFDHDAQTDFVLTGAHVGAACTACHREPTTGAVSAPADCEQCHRRDDPHAGRFGADCGGCHTTDSFSDFRGF